MELEERITDAEDKAIEQLRAELDQAIETMEALRGELETLRSNDQMLRETIIRQSMKIVGLL